LNGGKNSTDHSSEIKSTVTTGFFSGFFMELYLPKDHSIYYYINDAYVKPTKSEIAKYLTPGKISDIILEKTVEIKLENPFNDCFNIENLPDTALVRQLSEANITYRQVNCFELCLQNYVQKYALECKISEDEARESKEVKNYDTENKCNNLCPLECESTQYKVSQSTFSIDDLNIEDKRLTNISFIEKKLNIKINSTDEFNKNKLQLHVNFDSLKYTKISQTPKTSLSALISNLGGSTGLFLDLSFMSACRAIEFFLGVVFKF